MDDKFNVFDARIQTPTSMIVCGPSQSGKTYFTLELLENINTLFYPVPQKIYWFYGIKTKVLESLDESFIILIDGIPENGFEDFILPDNTPT